MSRSGSVRRSDIIRLLSILNYHYSLRDLQSLLGIPYQTLWRYVTLKCMPEERTSRRILERVEELGLIDRLVSEAVKQALEDPYALVRKPGFLSLMTLLVRNELHEVRVGVVVPMSEYALIPATSIALELHCEVCPALREQPLSRKGYYVTSFNEGGRVTTAVIPRQCLKDKGRAVLTDVSLDSVDKVEAFLAMLKSARAEVVAVVSVVFSSEVRDVLKGKGVKGFALAIKD